MSQNLLGCSEFLNCWMNGHSTPAKYTCLNGGETSAFSLKTQF